MKVIRLSWTDFAKGVHAQGLVNMEQLNLNLVTLTGQALLKVWPDDATYLDPEITGVLACPQARIQPTNVSNTTKQLAVQLIESLLNDMVAGTLPVDAGKAPTHHDLTTGTVVNEPT